METFSEDWPLDWSSNGCCFGNLLHELGALVRNLEQTMLILSASLLFCLLNRHTCTESIQLYLYCEAPSRISEKDNVVLETFADGLCWVTVSAKMGRCTGALQPVSSLPYLAHWDKLRYLCSERNFGHTTHTSRFLSMKCISRASCVGVGFPLWFPSVLAKFGIEPNVSESKSMPSNPGVGRVCDHPLSL